jgi:hypothetical protein
MPSVALAVVLLFFIFANNTLNLCLQVFNLPLQLGILNLNLALSQPLFGKQSLIFIGDFSKFLLILIL